MGFGKRYPLTRFAANPVILVHYHEIGLKGRNRSVFERKLMHNIDFLCEDLPIEKTIKISGRVLVSLDREAIQGELDEDGFIAGGLDNPQVRKLFARVRGIPGVARVSLGWRTGREFEEMTALAAEVLGDCEPFETFKVDSRRSNTDYPMHTMELNREIGAYLCDRFPGKKVRMEEPDVTVHVEVIQGSTYIYAKTERGTGGLPVGSSSRFVSLLSTGIDSPVAMSRIMHRGGVAIALHFSGAPETDDSSEYLVQDICDALGGIGGIKRLCIAKIGGYQKRIAEVVPARLRVVFFRRLMYTVANEVAKRQHAKAIVTGESLGQVASQTMENIAAVDAVARYPVFRPLIGSDKNEIMAEARRLGTYDLSTRACADCCTLFLPDSPETHANMREVEELAAQMDFEEWARQICDDMQVIEYRCCA